jgi:hypothetical protein
MNFHKNIQNYFPSSTKPLKQKKLLEIFVYKYIRSCVGLIIHKYILCSYAFCYQTKHGFMYNVIFQVII